MKKIVFTLLFCAFGCIVKAQDNDVLITLDGMDSYSPSLKATMEKQLANLFTAINVAEANGGDVNYSTVKIDNMASQSIGVVWNNVHFRTEYNDLALNCVRSGNEFEVRNIGVNMKPINDTYTEDLWREVCVLFDASGKIIDFNFAMDKIAYERIRKEGERLGDVSERTTIIQWCERFANAYTKMNKEVMNDIFSDDALIITGRVSMEKEGDGGQKIKVDYQKQNKQQYLTKLFAMFDRAKVPGSKYYINVKFDDYEVKRHPAKPHYYCVELRQKWNSSTYSDEGFVTLLWDFRNPDRPKIHVRVWEAIKNYDMFGPDGPRLP